MIVPALLAGAAAATAVGLPAPDRWRRVVVRASGPADGSADGPASGPADGPGAHHLAEAWRPRLRRAVPLLLALTAGLLRGPVAGLLVAMGALLVTRARARRDLRAGRAAERKGAVEACLALSSELRAGRMPADALAVAAGSAVGAVAGGLLDGAAAARLGADVPTALVRAADASAAPELLRGLAACWRVCSATGSGLAAAVDRLAEGLDRAAVQRRDVDAELAGPRATAALLAGLPLAGVALAAGLGARPVHVLLDTRAGAACLGVGIGLDLLGLWWTRAIVVAAGGEP